jgi:hypothetical protein
MPLFAKLTMAVASLYRGTAESLIVGFVSFGLLAAAWMLVARRAPTLRGFLSSRRWLRP